MNIVIDSREPTPHPWAPYLPEGLTYAQGTLETGDFTLEGYADLVVVERKTGPDLLGCIGANRDRFERELKRSRHIGHFCIIVESTLPAILKEARGIHPAAILGTITAWTRRYCPILFAGSPELAARLAFRWLMQPFDEAEKITKK